MTDAEQSLVRTAIFILGGPLAQARARRPDKEGWALLLSPEHSTAIHEAGHAIAGAAVGRFVHELCIVPNFERRTPNGQFHSGGFCVSSTSAETPISEPSNIAISDYSEITRAAHALTPFDAPKPRWRAVLATVRRLQQTTERLLDIHWSQVMALASVLERQKTMDRAAIEPYVHRLRVNSTDLSLLSACY